MSDWQVGDLAVCVRTRKPRLGEKRSLRKLGRIGAVYHVAALATDKHGRLGLVLEERRSDHPSGAFLASGFRKIRPDEHQACEEEFVKLLRQRKVSA